MDSPESRCDSAWQRMHSVELASPTSLVLSPYGDHVVTTTIHTTAPSAGLLVLPPDVADQPKGQPIASSTTQSPDDGDDSLNDEDDDSLDDERELPDDDVNPDGFGAGDGRYR